MSPEAENSIQIDVPAELVWAVTIDLEHWPEWTPTVTDLERLEPGPLTLGSRARVKQPGLPEAEWTVDVLDKCRNFTWSTRRMGLTTAGIHEIHVDGDRTRSVVRVRMSGWLAFLVWPFVRRQVGDFLVKENAGLKKHCEKKHRESSARV